MEESKRERVGGGTQEVLSPSLPNPVQAIFYSSLFFPFSQMYRFIRKKGS